MSIFEKYLSLKNIFIPKKIFKKDFHHDLKVTWPHISKTNGCRELLFGWVVLLASITPCSNWHQNLREEGWHHWSFVMELPIYDFFGTPIGNFTGIFFALPEVSGFLGKKFIMEGVHFLSSILFFMMLWSCCRFYH